jgi:hypothetical protein
MLRGTKRNVRELNAHVFRGGSAFAPFEGEDALAPSFENVSELRMPSYVSTSSSPSSQVFLKVKSQLHEQGAKGLCAQASNCIKDCVIPLLTHKKGAEDTSEHTFIHDLICIGLGSIQHNRA